MAMTSLLVSHRPRQLKGFAKGNLRSGETLHVTIALDQRAFSIWDMNSKSWRVVAGTYQVLVGDSSRNLPLKAILAIWNGAGLESK